MSKLEIDVKTMPGTSVLVGSEGAIHVRENGAVIRIVTAEQARDFARTLETAATHSEGGLIGGQV